MTDFKDTIAKVIKAKRKKLGVNQPELARLFNASEPLDLQTTQTDISKYERGFTVCPTGKFLKFQNLKK